MTKKRERDPRDLKESRNSLLDAKKERTQFISRPHGESDMKKKARFNQRKEI